jgi:signal transduction histidine kinase
VSTIPAENAIAPPDSKPPAASRFAQLSAAGEPAILGVASTLATIYGFSAAAVRAAFVLLAAAGGFGLIVYTVALLVIPYLPAKPSPRGRSGDLGIQLMAFGLAWWLCTWWPGASLSAVVVVGLVVGAWNYGWRPLDLASNTTRSIALRVAIGGLLLLLGVWALSSVVGSIQAAAGAAVWIAAAGVGLGLLAAPSIVALSTAHRAEREARIREAERSAVAAHLHDSVLQTLTLIGRNSNDSVTVAKLARRQERDLRRWLYEPDRLGVSALDRNDDWSAQLRTLADQAEDDYGVRVELVTVGEPTSDGQVHDACSAAGEAIVNAAKFAGVERISVYAELGSSEFQVYVRDRGCGFDPAEVDASRRGIAESVVARTERAGGSVVINSELGVGTEVSIRVPRELG